MVSSRVPPGPKGLLLLPKRVFDYGRDPLGYLTNLARRYGDVVLLPGIGMPFTMFSHPDHIEEILRHKHKLFKKDFYIESLRPLLGNGLLSSEGDEWRRQHAMAQPAFQAKQVQQYASTMVEYTDRLTSSWQPGQTRDFHVDMMRLTLQIVTKTLFDTNVQDEGDIGKDLEWAMHFYANPLSMWPAWRHVPTPTNLRFRATMRRLNRVIFTMIHERRAAQVESRTDLLSRLLMAEDDDGRKMSDTELRDQLMTLFLAGHETTALTLSYSFYLLAKSSEAEGILHAELDRVLGGRLPTVNDVPELCYTERVVKESMRLYPPAWAIGREALEDCEVGGYPIRKGDQVMMTQWVVHRDPRFWPEPERFDPSRWDDENSKNRPRCAYFPFGDGPRVCIGNNFAMMEAVLILAAIAQHYRLELASRENLRFIPSVTLRPRGGIKMIVRERKVPQPATGDQSAMEPIQYARS